MLGLVATNDRLGYWEFTAGGQVYPFGDATSKGEVSTAEDNANTYVVAMAAQPSGTGYILLNHDGGTFNYGTATSYGNAVEDDLGGAAAGIAYTHDGNGYWILGENGNVFPFGDATVYPGPAPNADAVYQGMVVTPDGGGYWLFDDVGDVYAYGDAVIYPYN